MKTGSINNTDFRAKILFAPSLNTKDVRFANKILNENLDGISNKKLIRKKDLNILFYSGDFQKNQKPGIKFAVSFDWMSDSFNTYKESRRGKALYQDGKAKSAEKLRDTILQIDRVRTNKFHKWQTFSNSFGLIKAYLLMKFKI